MHQDFKRLIAVTGAMALLTAVPASALAHSAAVAQHATIAHQGPPQHHPKREDRPAAQAAMAAPARVAEAFDGHQVAGRLRLAATAYGPSARDNYPYSAVDYYGNRLVAGDVAVDPRVIPLGTLLWVTGYKSSILPADGFLARAVDTGDAIKGARIDIFINAGASRISSFGIQGVTAYVLK